MSNVAPLTVRAAADLLGVTPRTLKYYEERGLVTPSRSEGRYRLYDAADIERFGRILRLRTLGFSLHGITEMLKRPLERTGDGQNRYSTESLGEIQQGLQKQLNALDTRIDAVRRELQEAREVRTELARDLDYVTARLAGVPADQLLETRRGARKSPAAKRGAQKSRSSELDAPGTDTNTPWKLADSKK